MEHNYTQNCPYHKAQIEMQVAYKIPRKKRGLHPVNEHFSREFYTQDALNMGFY